MSSENSNLKPESRPDSLDSPDNNLGAAEKGPEITPTPETTPAQEVRLTFPEGGVKAWSVVLGASLALGCAFGYLSSFGVYETYYGLNQLSDKSPSDIAWIGSTQFFFQYATSVISGPLFDLHGAKSLIIPGTISYVFSIMMTSLCKEYYQFILAQGVLGGMSTGMLFTPSLAAISHYFEKRRGFAIGICTAGSSLGGLLFPIGLKHALYSEKLGFGWGVRLIGFIILGLLTISCTLVQGRLPPRRGKLFKPGAFRQPSYSFLVSAIFLSMWALWVPYFFIVSFALEKIHMDANLSFYVLSLINAGSLFGRIIPGLLADKFGRLNVLVIVYAINSIVLFCWIAVDSAAGTIVWTPIFGFTSGAIISLYPATVAQITPKPQEIGTWMGQATGIVSIAGLTGPPIAGALINKYGWTATACFAGASMSACTILAVIARGFYNPKFLVKV